MNTQQLVNEVDKKIQQLKSELQQTGINLLNPIFQEFLEENPDIVAIRWQQYTPYFNDGEDCVFRIYDFCFELTPSARKRYFESLTYLKCHDDTYESNEEYRNYLQWSEGDLFWLDKNNPEAAALRNKIKSFSQGMLNKDLLHSIFGDHKRVEVTLGDMKVFPYTKHD